MSTERWKWRSSSAQGAVQTTRPGERMEPSDLAEHKKPRVLTKALRSMSNSSIDSTTTTNPTRSSSSVRRLQKNSSGSGSMIERLHRRMSKDSAVSVALSDGATTPLECSYASMEIIQHGPLKSEQSGRKAKSEYLVLTDYCLSKFANAETARAVYPQLALAGQQPLQRTSSSASIQSKNGTAEARLEIPHSSIVAVFNEGMPGAHYDLDVWWTSSYPRVSYCRTQFSFASSSEMDDWLTIIHRTCRTRNRKNPTNGIVPDNIRTRINHIVRSTESISDEVSQIPIFPVVKRTFGPNSRSPTTDDSRNPIDLPSFYLAIGPFMCYLVELLRADIASSAADLRAKVVSFGTVTLSRFKASVATHTQSFIIGYRPPFGQDVRLDLASVHYRRIIETLIRVDRALKPMWPQQLQQTIFDIRGLPPPLQLTAGNDLGGLETSLSAYCAAFRVSVPNWKIEWNAPSQPCFRLLPATGSNYSSLQLLAVFRALRYNSFFKAMSFENVDMTCLAGQTDSGSQGESLVHTSANLLRLSDDHYETLSQATTLQQEIHSLLFAADSIRSISLSNVFGLHSEETIQQRRHSRYDTMTLQKMSSEIIRPVLDLLRRQLCHCHSVVFSGNSMSPDDVDELVNVTELEKVHLRRLEVADCGLGESGLSRLWITLAAQARSLRAIDTSNNYGVVRLSLMREILSQLRGLTKLCIANNTRLDADTPLFDWEALSTWALQELDLSGIMLNDATVDMLAAYLATPMSSSLRTIRLDNCGLTSSRVARLLFGMGPRRELALHINASRLDEGIEELCEALAQGNGPYCLYAEMVDFCREENFVQLLEALTVNQSIQCLSLLGVSTPDDASETTCQAIFNLLADNDTLRYLDLSGYASKLDEGRLGRGFSKALRGLAGNTRLEHLRVRSQMLNINIGDLADAIASNNTLQTVDCEANDFTLSTFRHLINHLERNSSICQLSAFSEKELAKAIQKSMDNAVQAVPARRASVMSKLRSDKTQTGAGKGFVQDLKDEWDVAVQHLRLCLKRNRDLVNSQIISHDITRRRGSLVFDTEVALPLAFGGLALDDFERRKKATSQAPSTLSRTDSAGTRKDSSDQADGVHRSSSTNSGGIPDSPNSEVPSHESCVPTPEEVDGTAQISLSPDGDDAGFVVYGDGPDGHYTYYDSPELDGGLQMKRYQRFGSDPNNRIDEEDF